ncbi:Putative glucan endo-1,3-beta-glucosidase GVI [Triticum urartu]|uniref:Putative glucan endo-1,3-beta-glucosidase GVI n=1 Tax=Triticum urartu TaxID=4572 RepID=M7YR87_TRIUA|nr:Putative glucan endo-1,3-beta-glucosidase GVI [Triticum urartu]
MSPTSTLTSTDTVDNELKKCLYPSHAHLKLNKYDLKLLNAMLHNLPILETYISNWLGAEGAIGVNYGMIANNLPTPDKVIAMYKANKISYVRLFHPDTTVLTALRGTGIGVVLGTLNEDLAHLASDESFAASWVASYVKPFAGAVTFRYITAGNEVIPGDLGTHVLPAIRNIETALKAAGVTGVPVTTAVATSVLGVSYPPSQAAFSEASAPVMAPLVAYLSAKKAPLLVNVYPYFAYAAEPETVQLGYALLAGSSATSKIKVAAVADGGLAVETYLFAMFNENQKPEGTEQHFGLFQPDMSAVYPVDFAAGAY